MPARDYRFHPDQDNTVTVTLSTVVTRYVQLCFTANTGSNGGQLSEVEIYGPDRSRYELAAGVNLARGCPFQVTSDRYNGGSPGGWRSHHLLAQRQCAIRARPNRSRWICSMR